MTKARQGTLFGTSLNPISRLKAAMRQAIKDSRYSREQICDRMNRAASIENLTNGRGGRISIAALDGWVAETKSNLLPISLLPLFCYATESLLPLQVIAGCLDATVIDCKDAKLLALAKIDMEAKELARRKRHLQQEIEGNYHE